jgi:hypothetical protein
MTQMTITFGDDYRLNFDIESHPIAQAWLVKMRQRHQWPLDDAKRFYGFDALAHARERAEHDLRQCIDTINAYQPVIDRAWTSIDDQDLLNYLHNIFERYHGLLDQQNDPWWTAAPPSVRQALANLNIAVHRAESTSRGNRPRVVCTWFGMPKTSTLDPADMEKHGCLTYEFGGVYLNYVEIGKTLEDLSTDDDRYIGDDAFQPFQRYSADFNIRFYDDMADIARVYRYFEQHRAFFSARGIERFDDWRTMPWRFKVAQLRSDLEPSSVLEHLTTRQHITDIYLP